LSLLVFWWWTIVFTFLKLYKISSSSSVVLTVNCQCWWRYLSSFKVLQNSLFRLFHLWYLHSILNSTAILRCHHLSQLRSQCAETSLSTWLLTCSSLTCKVIISLLFSHQSLQKSFEVLSWTSWSCWRLTLCWCLVSLMTCLETHAVWGWLSQTLHLWDRLLCIDLCSFQSWTSSDWNLCIDWALSRSFATFYIHCWMHSASVSSVYCSSLVDLQDSEDWSYWWRLLSVCWRSCLYCKNVQCVTFWSEVSLI